MNWFHADDSVGARLRANGIVTSKPGRRRVEREALNAGARFRIAVGVLTAALLAMGAYGVAEKTLLANATPGEGVPAFGHVFVVVGENTEIGQLTPGNAAYLLGTIQPESAWFTDYFAVTHHSLANYVALTSGQFTACEQADGPPAECHQGVDNLFHQLDEAGLSWTVWEESMPAPCSLVETGNRSSLNPYATDHNPAVIYDDIEGHMGVWSATDVSPECVANVIPTGSTDPNNLTVLNRALTLGEVARYNLIVPNECQDGHSACPPIGDRLRQFDDFLRQEVPVILSSPAFGSDGVLIITYDEGTTGHFNLQDRFGRGGHVVLAIVSPLIERGLHDGVFDHYSLLRLVEDGFRLNGYLGNAARARAIVAGWY